MPAFDKLVVVTKKTFLEELIERFNTRDQARFYIEHMGGDFSEYELAHEVYQAAADRLKKAMPRGVRTHWIDRGFLPTFTFGTKDLVVTLGPDGLVVNTAKYLDGQPLLAFNPDPSRIDGVLIPFLIDQAATVLPIAVEDGYPRRSITMAKATLNDGRSILAVNDLFIGQKTHVSARYVLRYDGMEETQSSSGIIVSTGAGSTGWYRSILAGVTGVMFAITQNPEDLKFREHYQFDAEEETLVFTVREPFASRTSGAEMVQGQIDSSSPLTIVSRMPQNGVIFSDGVEEDYLEFNSGSIATVTVADRKLLLIHDEGQSSR